MKTGLMLLLLAGCTTKPYVPMPPAKSIFTSPITWITAESDEVRKVCDQLYGPALIGKFHGCAYKKDGMCYIYTPAPRDESDRTAMMIIGHEALHCFIGEFHR